MKEEIFTLVIVGTLILMLVALIFCTGGCQPAKALLGMSSTPDSPKDALITTVYKTRWIVTLGILGAAISIAALINGSRAAFGPLIGSLAAIVLDLMVIRYAVWLALGGLVAGVSLLVYVVYVRRRALMEIVATVEKVKSELGSTPTAVLLTGAGCTVNRIQSKTTKKLVDGVQEKLGIKKGGD